MDHDLSGSRIRLGYSVNVSFTTDIDKPAAAIKRFSAAMEALDEAWRALPVGVREHMDGFTVTFNAHPDDEGPSANTP